MATRKRREGESFEDYKKDLAEMRKKERGPRQQPNLKGFRPFEAMSQAMQELMRRAR